MVSSFGSFLTSQRTTDDAAPRAACEWHHGKESRDTPNTPV